MKAPDVLTPEDRKRIEETVARVESATSAEIVCAVATESGRYDRAESIVGLATALLALGLAHAVHGMAAGAGQWGGALPLGWQAFSIVAGFVAGNLLANRAPAVRRLVTSEKEMETEVQQASAHAFLLGAVSNTAGRTGLLVYISLFEHRVSILPDEEVRKALGDEEIGRLRDLAVADLKRGDFAGAFVDTIEKAGALLAKSLPASRTLNPNELPNHVLVFHPRPGCG